MLQTSCLLLLQLTAMSELACTALALASRSRVYRGRAGSLRPPPPATVPPRQRHAVHPAERRAAGLHR